MKKILALVLALMLVLSLAACGLGGDKSTDTPPATDTSTTPPSSSGAESTPEKTPENKPENTPEKSPEPSKDPNRELTFGDLVEFDDLEIVFGNEIIWSKIENSYSDHNDEDVFLVPITVKNTKNETYGLNMFAYTQFGSKGTTLDSIGYYFDDEVDSMGTMRPGALKDSYMAFLYDGDGDYYLEFDAFFGDKVEVALPIVWGDNSASPLSDSPAQLSASLSATPPADAKTFGEVFEFDGLEITFGSEIVWDKVSNQFSEHNGADVALVPITVKNIKGETHGLNMFSYTQFGSKGTSLYSVGYYFDKEVGDMGDMRSGASQDSYMAILYDGDGNYYVEFSDYLIDEPVGVSLPITK